jgi:hypothetical protein
MAPVTISAKVASPSCVRVVRGAPTPSERQRRLAACR